MQQAITWTYIDKDLMYLYIVSLLGHKDLIIEKKVHIMLLLVITLLAWNGSNFKSTKTYLMKIKKAGNMPQKIMS